LLKCLPSPCAANSIGRTVWHRDDGAYGIGRSLLLIGKKVKSVYSDRGEEGTSLDESGSRDYGRRQNCPQTVPFGRQLA